MSNIEDFKFLVDNTYRPDDYDSETDDYYGYSDDTDEREIDFRYRGCAKNEDNRIEVTFATIGEIHSDDWNDVHRVRTLELSEEEYLELSKEYDLSRLDLKKEN